MENILKSNVRIGSFGKIIGIICLFLFLFSCSQPSLETADENAKDRQDPSKSFLAVINTSVVDAAEGSFFKIINEHSGKALDVPEGAMANGVNIHQWDDLGQTQAQWKIVDAGDGYVVIINRKTGKALDVAEASAINGGNVHQWEDVGQENARWEMIRVSPDVYKIINKKSRKALDVAGAAQFNGANVQQWDYVEQANARWKLVAVSSPVNRPWQGIPARVPGKVEAENFDEGSNGEAYFDTDGANMGGSYRLSDSVDIQASEDNGGGYNIGWVQPGEWLNYTVSIDETTDYDIEVRTASPVTGGVISFNLNGSDLGTVTTVKTDHWQDWRSDSLKKISLPGGVHTITLTIDSGSFNLNYLNITKWGPKPPIRVPGKIEAEEYDEGPNGTAYFDTTHGNQGNSFRSEDVDIQAAYSPYKDQADYINVGYNVGWIEDGEWLNYTINVTKSAEYDIAVRTAGMVSGSAMHLVLDGSTDLTGLVEIKATGNWQWWRTTRITNIYLSEGTHTLTFFADKGSFNLDYLDITETPEVPWHYADKSKGEWTLVVIPDTQHYSQDKSNAAAESMRTAFQWITAIKERLNIKMVQGLGDITNDWANKSQWDNSKAAWRLLDGKVPYSVTVGNHDDPAVLHDYFPVDMFDDYPWWGGYMSSYGGGAENSYQLFEMGNEKYLFLTLETFDQYSPFWHPENNAKRDAAMAWAKSILENPRYADRKVILATHNNYDIKAGGQAEDDWKYTRIKTELLDHYDNFVLSNSGHTGKREFHYKTHHGTKASNNFITDYQHDAWETMRLRYYIFKPMEDLVEYYTFSPVTNDFEIDESSQGSFYLYQQD